MHPYEKADETDLYYTELANEIYHALDEACYTHNFKNMDDAKQLALSIAGYFEDVISGTGIWKTFTEECKQRYGTYIPFYEKESEFIKSTLNEDDPAYDPEEINIADVKFLLGTITSRAVSYRKLFLSSSEPWELAAKLAYNILDREYETAPENERLLTYLSEMPEIEGNAETTEEDIEKNKELDEIHRRDTLAWFHYGCYFNVGNQKAPAVYPPADGKLASGTHRTARLFCADGNDHRRQKQSPGAHFLRNGSARFAGTCLPTRSGRMRSSGRRL